MKCVICKRGQTKPGNVEAEVKVGNDHPLVTVEADVCTECGEAYYSADVMRYLEQVRNDFVHKTIKPPAVGTVYQLT